MTASGGIDPGYCRWLGLLKEARRPDVKKERDTGMQGPGGRTVLTTFSYILNQPIFFLFFFLFLLSLSFFFFFFPLSQSISCIDCLLSTSLDTEIAKILGMVREGLEEVLWSHLGGCITFSRSRRKWPI